MIDWVTVVIMCRHPRIPHGRVIKMDENGVIERNFPTTRRFAGSFESSIAVSSNDISECGEWANTLFLDGNPTKFMQGHNIIGSDDLNYLVEQTVKKVFQHLNYQLDDITQFKISVGEYVVKRIDITHYYEVGNYQNVDLFLDAVSKKSRTRSGKATRTKSTVYLNKHSKRWALKFYSKFNEIHYAGKGHSIPQVFYDTPLVEFCRTKVRAELVLRKLELQKLAQLENQYAKDIMAYQLQDSLSSIFHSYMERVDMSAQMTVTAQDELTLSNSIRGTYMLWKQGHDIKDCMSKPTFYRHRKLIQQELDIDISMPPVNAGDIGGTVVPLVQVIEAKPASIPDNIVPFIVNRG